MCSIAGVMCKVRHGGYLGILGVEQLYDFGVGCSILPSQQCYHFCHYFGV